MTIKTLRIGLILTLFVLIYILPSLAGENSISEMNALLTEEKRELEVLKHKIKRRAKKLSSVKAEERSLLNILSQLKNRVKLKERELQIIKYNIEINVRKTEKLRLNIKKTEKELEKRKRYLGRWLRVVYKEGGVFPVKVMFSSRDMVDLFQRIRFIDLVADYDASVFKDYRIKLNSLLKEKETLHQVRSDLLLLEKDAEIQKNNFADDKAKHRKFLRRLKREKSLGLKLRKELIKSSEDLDKIISEQEKKIKEGKSFNIRDHKGHLNYPSKGKLYSRYGKKRHKRYESYTVHNGITLKTHKNSSVRAVFSGQVLYTGFLEGYGNLVILGHGDEYHSVYGHLDRILVKKGNAVRKDQIIGKSGDSGSITGNSLYFELRKNGKAINPTSWFRTANK